jgi:hypothetical protein
MSATVQTRLSGKAPDRMPDFRYKSSLVPLLFVFGAAKVLVQIAITLLSVRAGYGIFRDELYYLVCSHRLAAGYVDQPPLVALQAWAAEAMFGHHHLVLFRMLPYLAGVLTVVLTGLLTQALGGDRKAAALAMLAVLSAPVYLATQSFLSMNAWDPVFWMAAVLALVRLLAQPTKRAWWLVLGMSAGLGLENKTSAIFLIAGILIALALTPARRLYRQPGFLLAIGVTVLLALPNLWWQVAHGFPTVEWLRDVQHSDKDVVLSPADFLLAQVLMLSPMHILLWVPGVAWLLAAPAARQWRSIGVLYVAFLGIMLALHAKDYYLAPIYPVYFAAGAVCWFQWAEGFRARQWAIAAYAVIITAFIAVSSPFAVPVLAPQTFMRYAAFMHFEPIESEQHKPTPLPEFYGDQLGWNSLADGVAKVYHALPMDEQRQTGIFAGNYGQASALNILGRPLGLPVAISGHQNYWMWGDHGYTGKEMIVVTDATPEAMRHFYKSCTVAAHQTSPYTMPWEQRYIYVCHDRYESYANDWAAMKLYR